jgi:mono/diheme cytochrome c family protein
MSSTSPCRIKSRSSSSTSDYLRAAGLAVAIIAAGPSLARAEGGLVGLGRDLAQRLCGTCHALGSAERSPNPIAPAFRHIEPRVDLDEMAQKLQEGIIGGHPEMPVFKLTGAEARALVAYMRSIQSDRKN